MSENITKQKLEAVRGMRDFLPADWVFRDKLMTIWNKVAADRGFSKYETPIVENLELFVRKAGEEISEQIYAFQDKSERELALRPEITPSMVRIFTSNREAFPSSGKIYSIGQCFRYERTTRGRKREHFQWNIDIIGEKSPAAEAWLIASAVNVMTELGFTADDFKVRVNSREIITDYLSKIGVSEDLFNDVFILMDKKEKVEKSYLMEEFAKVGLSTEQAESLYAFMEIKGLEDLAAFADTEKDGWKNLNDFMRYCQAMGIADFVAVDTAIIRGLAYYTGIVFEAFDINRELRAIFGGGRYDNLFAKMAGQEMAAVGMGFGDVVIEELYAMKFGRPEKYPGVKAVVGFYDDTMAKKAMQAADKLAKDGMTTDIAFNPLNFKKFFAYAAKRGAKYACYLAPDEFANGEMIVKNLETGEQITLKLDDIGSDISEKI